MVLRELDDLLKVVRAWRIEMIENYLIARTNKKVVGNFGIDAVGRPNWGQIQLLCTHVVAWSIFLEFLQSIVCTGGVELSKHKGWKQHPFHGSGIGVLEKYLRVSHKFINHNYILGRNVIHIRIDHG